MEKRKPRTPPTGYPGRATNRTKSGPVTDSAVPIERSLSLRVKAIYVAERTRWECMKSGSNTTYTPPRSYDGVRAVTIEGEVEIEPKKNSAWESIVLWCRKRKVSPEEYVRTCFYGLPLNYTAPEPRQLLGDVYWAKWLKCYEIMPRQLAEDLTRQRSLARSRIVTEINLYQRSQDDAFDNVLTDSHIALSPLFRFCLAKSLGTERGDEIAAIFQAEAVIQFHAYRALYEVAWESALPQGFAAMADKLYQVIISGQVAIRKDDSDGRD